MGIVLSVDLFHLGYALHDASPQVDGHDPPESGVSTASSSGWDWGGQLLFIDCFCYVVYCKSGKGEASTFGTPPTDCSPKMWKNLH